MVFDTGIDLGVFNVLKTLVVYMLIRPLMSRSAAALSTAMASATLARSKVMTIQSLGPFEPLFADLTPTRSVSTPPVQALAMLAPVLAATAWVSVGSQLVFEYGLSAQERLVVESRLVNRTSGPSPDDAQLQFAVGPAAQAALDDAVRRDLACPQFNNLTAFTDVYADGAQLVCDPQARSRAICASGYTLAGTPCEAPVINEAAFPAPSTEQWKNLLLVSREWIFVSNRSDEREANPAAAAAAAKANATNSTATPAVPASLRQGVGADGMTDAERFDVGFVTFIPAETYHSADSNQVFNNLDGNARQFDGVTAVHCGSGSGLSRPGVDLPGGRPFQVCIWEFEGALLVTSAENVVRRPKPSPIPCPALSARLPHEPFPRIVRQGGASGADTGGPGVTETSVPGKEASVRDTLLNKGEVQLSSVQQWVSIARAETGSPASKDIMLSMALLHDALRPSTGSVTSESDRDDHDGLPLWASHAAELRLVERALRDGVTVTSEAASTARRNVVTGTRNTATLEPTFLAQYLGSVAAFAAAVALLRSAHRPRVEVQLTPGAMLGWWAMDRSASFPTGKDMPMYSAMCKEEGPGGGARVGVGIPSHEPGPPQSMGASMIGSTFGS